MNLSITPREAETAAKHIAEMLFVNGDGRKADRLVLTKDFPKCTLNLGGWSQEALETRIREYLEKRLVL